MLTNKELVLVTNNEAIVSVYGSTYDVEFETCTYLDVLKKTRDKIHNNYSLLTHPMAGSLKPNQTPYKSVLLLPGKTLDEKSVLMIEKAIESAEKFLKFRQLPKWPEAIKKDFRTLDLSHIQEAVKNKHSVFCEVSF